VPCHKETKILPFSARQIFDLVMDIEKYPQFLPWCLAAKITDKIDENNLYADLVVNFKGFSQKYSSKVEAEKTSDDEFAINVVAIKGPFKNLVNSWKIKNIEPGGCKIEFFIDFEFKSIILEKMLGLIWQKATNKMIEAFEKRAQEKYAKLLFGI
jgi:coenzyme Q-binding protein COQ10